VPAALAENGIAFESLNMGRPWQALTAPVRLARIVRAWRPRIVHAHMAHASLLCRLTRLVAPMPRLVCTLHGVRMYNVDGTGFAMRERLHRFTDRLADRTTVVCQAAGEEYTRRGVVSPARLRVVPNGIDTDAFRPAPLRRAELRASLGLRDEFLWLSAGRLNGVKAFDQLLHAFHFVRNAWPDAHLVIAGEGDRLAELTALTAELGLTARVHFIGQTSEPADWLNAGDAFVLASHFEGLSLALLEAAACCLPIVATAVGGNPEIVDAPATGRLVPARDSQALAGAMLELTGLPLEQRQEMGRRGRQRVLDHYAFPAILAAWNRLYQELLMEEN
jgi:glycosyltransferase involved in cell wall biosynthesis